MNLLQKLGKILKVVGVVSGFIPAIEQYIPQSAGVVKVEDKLNGALKAIVTVQQVGEAMGAATASGPGLTIQGSDKLKAATPFVAQLIQNVELLEGKKPKDEALFEQAVTQITSGLADVLRSFGD